MYDCRMDLDGSLSGRRESRGKAAGHADPIEGVMPTRTDGIRAGKYGQPSGGRVQGSLGHDRRGAPDGGRARGQALSHLATQRRIVDGVSHKHLRRNRHHGEAAEKVDAEVKEM